MQLELRKDGKTKIYKTDFISARMLRHLLKFDEEMNYDNLSVQEIDELSGFVCEVFGNQFTVDELYDGIESHKLMPAISNVIVEVRSGGRKSEGNAKREG